MYMDVLPVCMSVHHMCTVLWKIENGVRSSDTRINLLHEIGINYFCIQISALDFQISH